tara:strand:+ start:4968 stop:8546 length:3579 start_codon:yes stop_codon:yes gene_type:complete
MPLTYNQTQYSTLTITGTSPNQEATISYSTLDFRPEIGDTIEVYNDTTKLTETTNYTLDTSLKNVVLKVNTFTPGTTISVYRIAKKDTRSIDFQNASVLTEADLDNSAFQTFHIAQEALDTAESSITADADGTFNAGNKRVKNVATPTADSDAATKSYADGGAAGQSILANESSIAKIGAGYDGTASTSGTHTNLAQINSVANNSVNINAVANDANDIGAVAGKATEIGLLGTSAMATATTGHIPVLANVVEQTVNYTVTVQNNGGNKFHIQGGEYGSATSNPVLTLIRGYTYVFDVSNSAVGTSVAGHPLVFMNGSTTLGTSDGVTTTGTAGQAGAKVTVVVSDSVTITKYSCSVHGDGMGNTINLRHDDFKEVADNATNITSVANNATNINTVAGNNTNINTVAGISANITTVASNDSNITSVASNATNINTVATNATNVNNVGSNIANVNSVATNISQVTTFADTYHTAGTTEPSGSNVTEGDLWFDTANDVLKVYDGSSWASASSSIATVASQNEFTASNGQGTDSKYFALNHDVGLELVFLNGVRLKRGSDYYCTNSNTSTTPISSGNAATFVRLETVPGSSDILSVMAFGQIANNLAVNTAGGTFTGGVTFEAGTTHNTGNNTFTLPTTRGTNGQVLTRTGSSGATTWSTTITQPAITSVTTPASDNSINEDDNVTMTINGSNFSNSMAVSLVDATSGNTVTGHGNLGIASFVSSAQITVNTVAATSNISNSNVKVKVDKSGLTATSPSISVSPDPTFSAPSSNGTTLATIFDSLVGNLEVVGSSDIVASSGSDAITYALDQTNTNANNTWQFNTSTGVVTSPTAGVYDVASGTSYQEPFTVTATAGGDSTRTVDRTFNIIVNKAPTGGDTGGTNNPANAYSIYEDGGVYYQVHRFTSVGTTNFVVPVAITADILVVAGGGGGAGATGRGAGGAGGLRWFTGQSLVAGSYSCEVGGGGANGGSSDITGVNGSDSRFLLSGTIDIVADGGGAGGGGYHGNAGGTSSDHTSNNNQGNGGHGGSGGGANYNANYGNGNVSGANPAEGYRGGTAVIAQEYGGGGGGGAGGVGGNGSTTEGGAGGVGLKNFTNQSQVAFTDSKTTAFLAAANAGVVVGSDRYIAGGGGGGIYAGGSAKAGGHGGGGDGGYGASTSGTNGTANTGGGGGGGTQNYAGGAGGSGIIIIRFAIS